ncbi:MAG: glycosyltransferase [Candidatus Pacebacteria bacterium]|jgi:glycosyltransferase involved in cell wall biosynthesis|nr:hypothetical protein [bacterium]MDP6528012.1 glycosyltransferase [Candidatus Paceibacterota bacterium]MDP6659689.1 glycosyltransferase [Candidatus Paceibacterota bacterium]|tara:strand:- start:39709 stop:40791 length:1083 start_codon:yes stop_codon:yes gene_type:complete
MKKIKVLAIYRGDILANRGTPIRVRSLLSRVEDDERIDLTVASWSEDEGCFDNHMRLTNNHLDDLKQLLSYVRKNKVDVTIGHTISASYYLLPIKFFTGSRIFLEMHGFIEEEAREYNSISWFAYIRMKVWNAIFFFFLDFAVTCSKSITDIIKKYNRKVVSLCGGVDISLFNPDAKSSGLLKRDDKIVIGYIGDAMKWQGLPFLVNSYKKLLEKDKDFRLAILTSERNKIEESEGIELFDAVPHAEVPGFMIDCDILVIPRPLTRVTKISYPSKLTEYLAMGKAIVVSRMGDADQAIEHGVNGMLYIPESESEFLETLLRLKDKKTRVSLGENAYNTAKNMSWERLSKRFADYIVESVK